MKKKRTKDLRDEFAMAALTGQLSNARIVNTAIDNWEDSGGARKTCVAEFIVGLAYEVADKAMLERDRTPKQRADMASGNPPKLRRKKATP